MAILYYFVNTLGSPEPDGGAWDEQGGTVCNIRNTLGIPRGTDIKSILKDIKEHERQGISFTGEKKGNVGGRPPRITLDTVYAQIIADCLEDGHR
jgi:hypothetical protein